MRLGHIHQATSIKDCLGSHCYLVYTANGSHELLLHHFAELSWHTFTCKPQPQVSVCMLIVDQLKPLFIHIFELATHIYMYLYSHRANLHTGL